MAKLPNKPSQLIDLAIDDLEKVENSERYRVNMSEWHTPYDETCHVCLAGAVMAMELQADPLDELCPEDFEQLDGALLALDQFRRGLVGEGLQLLWLTTSAPVAASRNVMRYDVNPTQFKADMRQMAKDFRELGL